MTALLLLGLACSAPPEPPAPAPTADAAPGPLAPSLYDLEVALVAADGRAVGLDVHRGHPALVSMFYASCKAACPMLVERVKAFEADLEPGARERLRVLLVSLDPARDDPAALREALGRAGVDPARWVLASPPPDRVREIAAALGVQYRPAAEGELHHSSVLVVLDPDGRELARAEATAGDLGALREALADR